MPLPRLRCWSFAALKMLFGVACLCGAARLSPDSAYICGWIVMFGVIFTLHFGLFDLLHCGWQSSQVNTVPLMNWPICSRSLSEFWGLRWNRAFRDFTHRFLLKPLSRRLPVGMAMFIVYLFSGLVHELVITLPARGGYGGPTVYFLLQYAGIMTERTAVGTSAPSRRMLRKTVRLDRDYRSHLPPLSRAFCHRDYATICHIHRRLRLCQN